MNEENNVFVYIRGVEGRGQEIIDTLVKLGGTNYHSLDGKSPNRLYYITHAGIIDCIEDDNSYNSTWFKSHYTEIEHRDKELVWCWDSDDTAQRVLRFYDAINKCTFGYKGDRNGVVSFENYEPYQGEYPDWAKEALTKLKD